MNPTVLRRAVGVALALGVALAVAWRDRIDVTALQAWIEGAGMAGPIVFVALYAAAAVLFLPGSVITLAGGALFGPLWGTLWNLSGATLGAALAFLIARYLGADWVSRRAGPRLRQLNDGVASEGWRFVAFVRLVPLFPFNLLNYALGLTRIRFATYAVASAAFMLPGAAAYTWLGHAGRQALGGDEGMVRHLLIALALVSAMAVLPRWVRKLRAPPMLELDTLKEQLDRGEELLVVDVRGAPEFTGEGGHIASASNVPFEELPDRLEELQAWKQRPVRLVCRTDRRSAQAACLLADAGFADVRVIRGGMTAWHARGWPVTPA